MNVTRKPNAPFIAEVFNLEKLVQYQDNSIVSRQLFDKHPGSLTVFAFDKGVRP